MKKFFKYFLAFVIVYILVDVSTYFILKSTYLTKDYSIEIENNSPEVSITEAKCTNVNGYIKGVIKNTTGSNIQNKSLKIDCFSKHGVNVGTKYVRIDELGNGNNMNFESKFNYDNVDNFKIGIVDTPSLQGVKNSEFEWDDLSKDQVNLFIILGAIIFAIF